MNEIGRLTAACALGGAAGLFFFGGLWWTVRHFLHAKHPAFLMALSFLVRTAVVLAVFYMVGRDHADRLLVCCGGFVLARFFFVPRLREMRHDARRQARANESVP